MFKTIRSPFYNEDDLGGGASDDSQSGKLFSQEDVDRILGERLARERSSKVDYDDLKEVTALVQEFGYQGTPAEIKAALKAEVEGRRKAAELQSLEEEAAESGTSPELLAEIKELKKELAEIKQDKQKAQKEQESRRKAEEAWTEQVTTFQEKHPEIDVDKLGKNEKFLSFMKKSNPNLSLVDIYETYIDLVGSAEKAAIDKIIANDERTTSSGKAKGDPTGGTHGLNDQQQKLARENGMSFKEYSERLKDIN